MKSLAIEIATTKARLRAAKPRSHLHLKLELQLRALMTKQIKRENKQDRRAA